MLYPRPLLLHKHTVRTQHRENMASAHLLQSIPISLPFRELNNTADKRCKRTIHRLICHAEAQEGTALSRRGIAQVI